MSKTYNQFWFLVNFLIKVVKFEVLAIRSVSYHFIKARDQYENEVYATDKTAQNDEVLLT